MKVTQVRKALNAMRKGKKVTFAKVSTGIFFQLCHAEKVVMLNTNGCQNGITAYVDKVMTEQEFLKDCALLGRYLKFKLYE